LNNLFKRRTVGRRGAAAALGSALDATKATNRFAHILLVERNRASLVNAKASRRLGAELGGLDQAEIAADESNLADLVLLFVCRHSAPAMLGVDGEAASVANANAIARTIDATNDISAVPRIVAEDTTGGHTLSRHG
jgi:hypothetical protein